MITTDPFGKKQYFQFEQEEELKKKLAMSLEDDNVRTIQVYKDGLNRHQRRQKAAEERKSKRA